MLPDGGDDLALRSLTPVLVTRDIPATINFLESVFGFRVEARADEFAWARLVRDNVRVMLSGPFDTEPDQRPQLTGSLYIECDDVDAEWRAIAGRARVCFEPETLHYGMREFGVHDNNDYLYVFATPAPSTAPSGSCD